jgi:cyanophycinase-like exopeptidase
MRSLLLFGLAGCALASNITESSKFRLVMGGSTNFNGILYNDYDGKRVVYITAAGTDPVADATALQRNFDNRRIPAAWCGIHSTNCNTNVNNPTFVRQIEEADAIFLGGGQSGRLQSCLFGTYATNGAATYRQTPILTALQNKLILGGSSAGAMNQPGAEILVTGSSVESYQALRQASVFFREVGNRFVPQAIGLVDTHFSERGRQGRLLVLAAARYNRFAFGADEDTMFKWYEDGQNTIEVIGTRGVVVYEDVRSLTDATMHFLSHGDKIVNGVIQISPDKTLCTSSTRPANSNAVFDGVNFRTISIQAAEFNTRLVHTTFHGSPAVRAVFDNREAKAYCGGSRFGKSFTNLRVTMGNADDYDFAEPAKDYLWLED